mmetsp:Transcript_98/g.167  ORF Transcript_98/g.167 Transcript_98/m.167 type:complete len:752 (-) Transcript_98:341-2596(-)
MGAAASAANVDQLTPELRECMEANEKMKFTISEYDSAMLDRETTKVFKKHGKIIKTLTSRTKAQNKRTLTVKKKSPEDIYNIVGGNNNYAKFMKMLFMSKAEIEMEVLKANKADLYDEEFLINVIGTSSSKELKAFDALYTKEKGESLLQVFEQKLKPDSQIQKFVGMILMNERDESKTVDADLAAKQADEIHKAGAARLLGSDDDIIFDILINANRAQCAQITDQYLSQHHMKFERAINMKFKGNCGKLMILWAQPLPNAVVSCLNAYQDRMLVDKVAVISMVAKYDKEFLAQADIASEKMFEKNLIGMVQRGLSGNLLKAVTEWIENPSPDKGFERVLELFLDSQVQQGRSLEELLKKDEFQARLLFLQKKEKEELEKYMKENRIKFNPEDKFDLKSLISDSFDEFHESKKEARDSKIAAAREAGVEIPPDSPKELNKYSKKSPKDRNSADYTDKFRSTQGFLQTFFENLDPEEEGSFLVEDFWKYMYKLPLAELGLTEESITGMRDWTEWETDGRVYYNEVLFELADSVLTAIETKEDGNNDVVAVLEALDKSQKLHHHKSEAKIVRNKSVLKVSSVPDYFLEYVYFTLNAFDFDQNGYLSADEFASLLPIMNIGMEVSDFLPSEDASITHKEAATKIAEVLQSWFEDKEDDNYICLVDKDSGCYFWYNTRDESSQWADDTAVEGWSGASTRQATSEGVSDLNAKLAELTGSKAAATAGAEPSSPRAPTIEEEKEVEAIAEAEAAAKE